VDTGWNCIALTVKERLTALIISEIADVINLPFVCVHFGIETIVFLEDARQSPSSGVDTTPVGDAFGCINFRHDILQMSFAKRLNGHTLLAGQFSRS
jgi:hypothetical protein